MGNDERCYMAYAERWRVVATLRNADADSKERFVGMFIDEKLAQRCKIPCSQQIHGFWIFDFVFYCRRFNWGHVCCGCILFVSIQIRSRMYWHPLRCD